MKKNFKKTLSLLLVVTNFTFLCTNLTYTYANSDTKLKCPEDGPYSYEEEDYFFGKFKKSCYEDKNFGEDAFIETGLFKKELSEFVVHKGLPFYIEKGICLKDPKFCSKSSLQQIFQNAKDKIYEKLGLNYTDEIKTKIFVREKSLKQKLFGTEAGNFRLFLNKIFTYKDELFNQETLSHEMTHALLHNYLNPNYYIGNPNNIELNDGIDEGLATQIDKLGDWGAPFGLFSSFSLLFSKSYPSNIFEEFKFYALHQRLVHDWIESEGKGVVKKWLEEVKNGKDSVKAFRELGGDKIVDKYKSYFESNLKFKCIEILGILGEALWCGIRGCILGCILRIIVPKVYNKVKNFFKTSFKKERSVNTHVAL